MNGTAGLDASVRTTTSYSPVASALKPATMNAGRPFTFTRRLIENSTSAAVSGVPSWKTMPRRIWNVNSVASALTVHDSATFGCGSVMSVVGKARRVSYTAWCRIVPVASN